MAGGDMSNSGAMSVDAKAALVNEVLDGWHLKFAPAEAEDRTPSQHGSFSDSIALTHCICYGAAWRMLDHLIAQGWRPPAPPSPNEAHRYTVDVILHGAEPYPCVLCGRPRQATLHQFDDILNEIEAHNG